jgi:hypothetical protein
MGIKNRTAAVVPAIANTETTIRLIPIKIACDGNACKKLLPHVFLNANPSLRKTKIDPKEKSTSKNIKEARVAIIRRLAVTPWSVDVFVMEAKA